MDLAASPTRYGAPKRTDFVTDWQLPRHVLIEGQGDCSRCGITI